MTQEKHRRTDWMARVNMGAAIIGLLLAGAAVVGGILWVGQNYQGWVDFRAETMAHQTKQEAHNSKTGERFDRIDATLATINTNIEVIKARLPERRAGSLPDQADAKP